MYFMLINRLSLSQVTTMQQSLVSILSNRVLCQSMHEIDFLLPSTAGEPVPGQFFTARVTTATTPLLRRPFAFSAFNATTRRTSCIYQIRGQGTELLSALRAGDTLDIIAPLGKPFPLPTPPNQRVILVAGGIGLGPILFLARTLRQMGIEFISIFGCRNAAQVPSLPELENRETIICTDDGSTGFHGNVAEYLNTIASTLNTTTTLYCCGPHPMLHACHQLSLQHHFLCFVSVEQIMACGVGACMGCAIKVPGPMHYVRACKEGPVFESKDILWEE